MRDSIGMTRSGGVFGNLKHNLVLVLGAKAMWAWVGVVVSIHALVELRGGVDASAGWFRNFGCSLDGILQGKVWQLLSYGMFHGSWPHLALNSLFLLVVGSRIERMVGHGRASGTVIAGIAGGAAGHLLLGDGLLVGLSGACFALLLMLTTLSPDSRMLPIPLSAKSVGAGVLAAALLVALVNPALDLPGFGRLGNSLVEMGLGGWFRMGHGCHLGGGIAGWILARWILRPRVTLDRLRRERARREAG